MAEAGAIGFAGYDLPEVLHEEGEVVLLRCVRQADGRPVLAWLALAAWTPAILTGARERSMRF